MQILYILPIIRAIKLLKGSFMIFIIDSFCSVPCPYLFPYDPAFCIVDVVNLVEDDVLEVSDDVAASSALIVFEY